MVFPVRDVKLHVAVETEVSIQPDWLSVDLVKDAEEQLLCGNRSVEDTHSLLVGHPRVRFLPFTSTSRPSFLPHIPLFFLLFPTISPLPIIDQSFKAFRVQSQ